jgi:RNA polymerase sigma factor (sigma-70 family)
MDKAALAQFLQPALNGDRGAVESIVKEVQDWIYNLAIRMLWHPADAEDATQEILLKIVSNLHKFRGESSITTWIYSIATNYLLTTRKRRAEMEEMSFDDFENALNSEPPESLLTVPSNADEQLLENEVKIGCMQGMLLCLDRDHRIVYILGEIFDVSSEEGAEMLNTTPVAFRKRLSRARDRIRAFMKTNCGLVNEDAQCRCSKQVPKALATNRINPDHLLFARRSANTHIKSLLKQMDDLERSAALFRGHPEYIAPPAILDDILKAFELADGNFKNLGGTEAASALED